MSIKTQWIVGKAVIEAEGEDVKDVFGKLAESAEVFGHQECGMCGSSDVFPQVRHNKGFSFYAMKCSKCGAEMNYGQRREDGHLFPKNHGEWSKWGNGNDGGDDEGTPF